MWERDIPLVTIDRKMLKTHADFVGTDNRAGGRLAAQYLLELGHRRFAHLSAIPEISSSRERWEGFRDEINRALGVEVDYIAATAFRERFDDARSILDRPDRPTAVFAGNDYLAASTLEAARVLGISVPNELSVVGFADLSVAAVSAPPLTTVKQEPFEIGRKAAEMVLDRIRGDRERRRDPQRLEIVPRLVIRKSTAPPVA